MLWTPGRQPRTLPGRPRPVHFGQPAIGAVPRSPRHAGLVTGYHSSYPSREAALSAAGVVAGVKRLQALARDVSIDLSRGQIAVAEQQLDHTQVRAVVEQMRSE